jgi:hypothetical protein
MTDDTTPEGGQRELCAHCGGNGVVKLVGGVSVCPRCRGECYEPGCSRCAAQSSRLRSLEQRLRDLEGYVQHKPDCWTRTASTFADAEAATCTCGLSTRLIDQG